MKIAPFELERWQSVWENRVELNISESGVEPMSVQELVGDAEALGRLLATPLGYPQTNGSAETRAGVARLYPGARAENVLMTSGGSEANYVTTWALIEPGDELISLEPNYMQVAGAAAAFGARVKPLRLREALGWLPDTDELRRLITSKTKLIVFSNPNNPTGSVFSERVIQEICSAAASAGAWILADEIYRGAERNGGLTPTFWGRYERVICTAGMSKSFGLPGLRTGWVVAPAEVAEKLWGYHDYTSIATTMLSDRLAALALEPSRREEIFNRTRSIIQRNYAMLEKWLSTQRGRFTHVPPAAGAIAWVGCPGMTQTSAFADQLRAKKSVLIVPGEQFSMAGYMRIGFGYQALILCKALERTSELLDEISRD